MKTNKLYMYREIAGEALLVPVGEATKKFNGMISLPETAAFIWKRIDTAGSVQDIVKELVAEYEVDETTATQDVLDFLHDCVNREMVFDVPELNK